MAREDILGRLKRTDKWYLGGGNRLIWAPSFPVFLNSPGLWDEAHYYNFKLEPVFAWTLLDEDGNELKIRFQARSWDPSCLTQHYTAQIPGRKSGLEIIETKSILPSDVAISGVRIRNGSRRPIRLHFIAWSVQDQLPSKQTSWLTDVDYSGGVISFNKYCRPSVAPHFQFACAFGINRQPKSHSINLSERTALQPHWNLTPWFETFRNGKLPGEINVNGVTNEGLVYMALHTAITARPQRDSTVTVAFAAAPSIQEALQNLKPVRSKDNPILLGMANWHDHFNDVPRFECSDEFLTRYYWYRWYGLRLNTMYGSEGNYRRPFVCEGIGYFRAPISYSAPCHMLENRWMHEPELARGSLLTFLDNQREDGGFRGYIDVAHYRQEMFYHANWGNALLQLHLVHPSSGFLEEAYDGLKRYVGYFDRERDEEVSGLYDIDNHYETGQEYMHRYVAVDPKADQDNWGEVFRLKGVDVTVYLYELKRALGIAADWIGNPEEAELWRMEAEKIKVAILERMWDPEVEMFFDVDPQSGERTMVKAATCFYPYFTDITSEAHVPGLKRHLLNPKEFWTPFPVPSSSADDEYFSAHPGWKGKRRNCPWNGRVWPMTNSHVVEALATAAIRWNDQVLKRRTAELIGKFIRMMFFEGKSNRPNCFEHYNPSTGKPSVYRGIDDYQHSWVNDLIIKYVCGIRPDEFSVTVDPFPFALRHLQIDDVRVRGRRLRVEMNGERFTVWLDDKQHAKSVVGKPLTVQI